jgi:cob(I)alamin adenosyltransferase
MLTKQQKIQVRENAIRNMQFEMEDLKVKHSVQENLGKKDRMRQIEEQMEEVQKSIDHVQDQIKELEEG